MRRNWTLSLSVISTVLTAHFLFWAWKDTDVFQHPYTYDKWASAFWEFFPAMLFMGAGYLAIHWRYGDKGRE
jgi:hypothetical protein